jgi:membrane-bound lytic murein transglycosylase D
VARFFLNSEHYGISLKPQAHKPTFMAVDIGSQLELSKAAQLSDTSVKVLLHLNPGLRIFLDNWLQHQ